MTYTISKLFGYYHIWITNPITTTDTLTYVHKLQRNPLVHMYLFLTLEEVQQLIN